jgi:hypothetical protein
MQMAEPGRRRNDEGPPAIGRAKLVAVSILYTHSSKETPRSLEPSAVGPCHNIRRGHQHPRVRFGSWCAPEALLSSHVSRGSYLL